MGFGDVWASTGYGLRFIDETGAPASPIFRRVHRKTPLRFHDQLKYIQADVSYNQLGFWFSGSQTKAFPRPSSGSKGFSCCRRYPKDGCWVVVSGAHVGSCSKEFAS